MPRLTTLLDAWASLDESDEPVDSKALADALLRASESLTDEMLRSMPATPEDAAAAIADNPFADRVEGAYLPFDWMESFCSVMRLPLAEIDAGWDISDGEDVYLCPRALLADDPDEPDDVRAFVRVDQVRRWERPE